MTEQPASSVDEHARRRFGIVTLSSTDLTDLHLTGWEQVQAWLGSVAQGDVTSHGSDGEHFVVGEVFEQSTIRCPNGELRLDELVDNSEEAHLVGCLPEVFLDEWALYGLSEHIDFY